MEIREAIRGTGAVRDFVDEPIEDSTLHAILDDARFAPSGGNRQGWRVAIVRDRSTRRELADLMQPVWNEYIALSMLGQTPFNVIDDAPPNPGADHVDNPLLDTIESVPIVLAVAADMSCLAMMDKDLDRSPLTGGASVYPFCWNVLLAARDRGLGGVITTFLSRVEPAAAPLLGLPPDHALAATIFLGRPVHQPTKLKRNPVEMFTRLDRFDGPAFEPGSAVFGR